MRYANIENALPEVYEIESIEVYEAWNGKHDTDAVPDELVVTMHEVGWNAVPEEEKVYHMISGEYLLDGTEKTYLAAKENYRHVAMKMLTKGYCDSSDFSNFDWD